MDATSELKKQVRQILKHEISDYLAPISEENSIVESSVLDTSANTLISQTQFYTNPTYLDESQEDSYEDSLGSSPFATSSPKPMLDPSNRQGRSINLEVASQFFKKNQQKNSLLWEAIERNDLEEVDSLLFPKQPQEFAAQINAPGLNNWTALHMAAARGFAEICNLILSHADPYLLNSRTSMNRTPLHLATIHHHFSIVVMLLESGAKIDLIDNDYNTSLHYASSQGYEEIVEYLLISGSNISLLNNLGRTPVDTALNYEIFHIFVEYCGKMRRRLPETGYTRTVLGHSLRHNSREDQINKMLYRSKISPSLTDFRLFNERPKLERGLAKKKYNFRLPDAKVGPRDFTCILQLGKGSFGHVYLIKSNETEEKFALKVLDKDKVFMRHLERYAFTERNILMKITHPFIVKLHYAFQTPEKLALVMDYCSNGDMGMALQREKTFSEQVARFYIVEITLALQELHRHNIIFRDLKPDNILIDEKGHIKLTDFGLSKEGIEHGKMAKSFCGSAAYFAPEMIKRDGHTKSIDWYVLGAILYEMLIGKTPYYSTDRNLLYNNIKRGELRFPIDVSEDAKDLIAKLLTVNPKKRLGSSKMDAEEIKIHPFFAGVDWNMYLQRKITPPLVKPITRLYKTIPLVKVYGRLEDEEEVKLQGWSVLENH